MTMYLKITGSNVVDHYSNLSAILKQTYLQTKNLQRQEIIQLANQLACSILFLNPDEMSINNFKKSKKVITKYVISLIKELDPKKKQSIIFSDNICHLIDSKSVQKKCSKYYYGTPFRTY